MLKGVFLVLIVFLQSTDVTARSSNHEYRESGTIYPDDYLYGSHGPRHDSMFDDYRTIDLNVDLGIGSDCGRIDFRNTLRAAMQNILDSKYLGDLGRDIVAASPLLLTCYFSPTWCAIVKHSQLSANFMAGMRLNQCALIDRYTDARVQDFEEERQQCVRKRIKDTNGNFEEAMESCKNYWDSDISDWSGNKGNGGKASENRLIGSSARWAGLTKPEDKKTVELLESMVGDTVIQRGNVAVDFGPDRLQQTPRTYLTKVENKTFDQLCGGIVDRVVKGGGPRANVERVVSERELKEVSGNSDEPLVDYQTIRSLSLMPTRQRQLACKKLSDAIAMTVFVNDMGKSIDLISSKVETNPNLPEHRKLEAERKRLALKDQIEITMSLYKNKNEPLNQVLYQINNDGKKYQSSFAAKKLEDDEAEHRNSSNRDIYFDCSDSILCNQ